MCSSSICAGEEPLVRCLRDLSSQNGPSFFLPLHEARQVLCHGGLCLSLGLCYRGTSVGGGVHGFESRGKKDFKSQDKRSKGPLEPKWWPKWILIKSQDKRPPTVNALAQYMYYIYIYIHALARASRRSGIRASSDSSEMERRPLPPLPRPGLGALRSAPLSAQLRAGLQEEGADRVRHADLATENGRDFALVAGG